MVDSHMGRRKTIKLNEDEYRRLTKAKQRLKQDVGADLAFGTTVAFLAGLLLGDFTSGLLRKFPCPTCGYLIGTSSGTKRFLCPNCGSEWVRQ